MRWALKTYVRDRVTRISTHAGYSVFSDVWAKLLKYASHSGINSEEDIKDQLIEVVENAIAKARSEHKLYSMYRPIQWYIWCAENYPELGFCTVYSMELEGMSIPGNQKGEAVRMEDPDKGPLHRSLEFPLLVDALKRDQSTEFLHLQQKAVVALCIAFGRNPANLTFLRESDLEDLTPDGSERCYALWIPRIKKRQLNPRDDRQMEYLDPVFASCLLQLIHANKKVDASIDIAGKTIPNPRPLFVKVGGNQAAILSNDMKNVYNMTSFDITKLLRQFVERHEIISPLTGELLQLNVRRLRYTLATGLVAEGISRSELARILDHTDTQHVQVYFELAGGIVEHLDKAAAKGFSKYLDFFRGKIIETADEAVNGELDNKHLSFIDEENPTDQTEIGVCGESKICHLDPPFSCYLCPKFQPYRHADHEHVLDCLLRSRAERIEKYTNSRLGVQLDDVIAAVAQVAKICEVRSENV